MKTKLLLVLWACLFLATTSNAQHTVAAAWANNDSSWTACSSTVTTACLVGQQLSYQAGSTSATPVVVSSTISPTASSYSIPVPANNTYSTWYLSLTITYLDMNGTTQTGAAATCGTSNTPPPCAVTNVSATPQGASGFTATAQ